MIIKPRTGPKVKTKFGVSMSAQSGAGIVVADDSEINYGASDFSIAFEINAIDYTPASDIWLVYKFQDSNNRWGVQLITGGQIRLFVNVGGSTVIDVQTVATVASIGPILELFTVSVSRESASSDGSFDVYVGDSLLESVVISAASPASFSNTGSLRFFSDSINQYASITNSAILYNRALSASEVLDLYSNGVAAADVGASQTALNTDDWVEASPLSSFSSTPTSFSCVRVSGGTVVSRPAASFYALEGQKIFLSCFLTINSGAAPYVRLQVNDTSGAYSEDVTLVAGHNYIVLTSTSSLVDRLRFIPANNSDIEVSDISMGRAGATLQLESSGIAQGSGLTWLDSSGNGNNATLPATGATKVTVSDSSISRYL